MPIEWHYVEKRICFPYCRDCNTEAENLCHGFLEGGCWGLLMLLKICGCAMSMAVRGTAQLSGRVNLGFTHKILEKIRKHTPYEAVSL